MKMILWNSLGVNHCELRDGHHGQSWNRPIGRHSASRPSTYTQASQMQYPVQMESVVLPPINLSSTSTCLTTGKDPSE